MEKEDASLSSQHSRSGAFFIHSTLNLPLPMLTRLLLTLLSVASARAQFTPAWLHDDAYWGDGKAEFNTYDAQQVRYGQPRECEVIHILVREPFADRELVKAEPGTRGGTFPVIKLNQILHIPTGLYTYQQMHSAFWRADTGALVKATLTSNDSCGNTYKEFRALPSLRAGPAWRYEWRTYWEGMSAGDTTVRAAANAVFYDELPLRVRTLDFTADGTAEFPLAPSIIRSKADAVKFAPAKIKWTRAPDAILAEVVHPAGTDRFTLDPKPPHMLREWQQADGGRLTLRRSLKIDYWNYNKPGDKERALAQ